MWASDAPGRPVGWGRKAGSASTRKASDADDREARHFVVVRILRSDRELIGDRGRGYPRIVQGHPLALVAKGESKGRRPFNPRSQGVNIHHLKVPEEVLQEAGNQSCGAAVLMTGEGSWKAANRHGLLRDLCSAAPMSPCEKTVAEVWTLPRCERGSHHLIVPTGLPICGQPAYDEVAVMLNGVTAEVVLLSQGGLRT